VVNKDQSIAKPADGEAITESDVHVNRIKILVYGAI
jgi:hypothetical protein